MQAKAECQATTQPVVFSIDQSQLVLMGPIEPRPVTLFPRVAAHGSGFSRLCTAQALKPLTFAVGSRDESWRGRHPEGEAWAEKSRQ